jgi:hypothetical protein
MAQNHKAIYTLVPKINWGAAAITAANTAKDGTGTVDTIFTADATNGSFVQKIKFRPAGANVQTVARIFINNGSTNATAANNILYDEVTLPATTLSETGAINGPELYLNIVLPAGYKINVTLGTAVAAGYYASIVGGDY